MARNKHIRNYAFIDSQNLNMSIGSNINHKGRRIYYGWRLDFEKFRRFLKDKYKVEKAFLFIGNLEGQEELYETMQQAGYEVILKPTTSYTDPEGNLTVKGNVDTDLVLYAAAREINNYDKAIIVTGDGDFLSLLEYLDEKNKLGKVIIPNKVRYSQLLNKFVEYFDYASANRKKLEKDRPAQYSEDSSMDEPTYH
jgi:uncharacterized LabA/DUF88 family protein